MTARRPLRLARAGAGLLLAAVALVGLGAPAAQAADGVASYTVTGTVDADGTLGIKASLALEGSPEQVRQSFATTLDQGRDRQYVFTLSDVTASVGGQAVTPTIATQGAYQVITVPLSGRTGPVELDYRVRGAALDTGHGTTEINWRVLQGLSLPVRTLDATFVVPGLPTSLNCYAGPPGAPGNCTYFAGGRHDQADPLFHDEGRGAGEVVGVVMRFPSSVVHPNQDLRRVWTLDGAFSVAPLPLALALGAAALGGAALWLAHRRFGRDAAGAAQPATLGSFRPVGDAQSAFTLSGDLRPAEVGTLADERVDPIDVTASVLDLAVRNHLLITELPRAGAFKPTDWTLERVESGAALLPYERTLLDAVAPAAGGPRRLAEVAPALQEALPQVQAQLYDEVVRKGWFAVRPDHTRSRWSRLGWVALAAAVLAFVLLVVFTPFGLLGLVLIALAAALGWLGQAMPARTAKGASALAGLGVLRGVLLTQPTDQMPRGREHAELSQVLPYAVVLGAADRWLAGIAAVDDPGVVDARELSWYHGPEGWRLTDLPDSLRNFVRAFQGTLVGRG